MFPNGNIEGLSDKTQKSMKVHLFLKASGTVGLRFDSQASQIKHGIANRAIAATFFWSLKLCCPGA